MVSSARGGEGDDENASGMGGGGDIVAGLSWGRKEGKGVRFDRLTLGWFLLIKWGVGWWGLGFGFGGLDQVSVLGLLFGLDLVFGLWK